MSSYLDIEGVYDARKMFAVTNWSDEDFTISWKDDTGENVYTIKAGEVKTYPQYLAYYITKNFVDREMYKLAEAEQETRARERLGMAVSNKDLRKPYEDMTLIEVKAGQESPEVVAMRAKIRSEVEAEMGMSNEIHPTKEAPVEFAGLEDVVLEEGDTIVVDQELLDENPVLAEAGIQVGTVGTVTNTPPKNESPLG